MKINKELKFNSGEGKAAISIVNMIQDLDGQAFIVGGAVRDALLGIEPKDVDIATDQRLESLASIFGKDNVNFVGESFGVAIVSHMGEKVEVATFRKDGEYTDGRRPDTVEFSTSAEDDSNRRDLTINALFFDPVENVLHDFHGGLEDLEDSIIRTVGDPVQRFSEDNLRMLRVVRFAIDDLKTIYLEAACLGSTSLTSAQLGQWFWRATMAGQVIAMLRSEFLTSTDKGRRMIASFMVPGEWVDNLAL